MGFLSVFTAKARYTDVVLVSEIRAWVIETLFEFEFNIRVRCYESSATEVDHSQLLERLSFQLRILLRSDLKFHFAWLKGILSKHATQRFVEFRRTVQWNHLKVFGRDFRAQLGKGPLGGG